MNFTFGQEKKVMNKLTLSSLLPFGNQKKAGKKKSNKRAQSASRLSNKPAKNQKEEILFKECADQLIEKVKKDNRNRCADNYRMAVRSFLKFLDKPDIPTARVSPTMTKHYEQWLCENGVSRNASSCYMRSLRAVYNKVVKDHKLNDRKPFDNVFTGNDKTVKRSIDEHTIVRIADLDLKAGTRLCMTRDLFMFSFYAMGMPFVDIAHLKKNQIKRSILTYNRHKTDSSITVKLESCALEIMKRYDDPKSEFVFPILKGATAKEKENRYHSALCYYNQLLKKIGELAGLAQPLTSYVARHTWASAAYKNGVDINVISQALGHSSPIITLTYIRELDCNLIFKANKKVLKGIKSILIHKRYSMSRPHTIPPPKNTHY
jgi:integrase/recombinase XerD